MDYYQVEIDREEIGKPTEKDIQEILDLLKHHNNKEELKEMEEALRSVQSDWDDVEAEKKEKEMKELEDEHKLCMFKEWVRMKVLEESNDKYHELLEIVEELDLTYLDTAPKCECKMCSNMRRLKEYLYKLKHDDDDD